MRLTWYNYLNLPQLITFTGNRTIGFVYDASGAKLQKITNDNGTIVTQNYINGVEYIGNTLERIPHAEGEIVNRGGSYVYEYALKDHLGNTRVTFTNIPGINTLYATDIKQINSYYPFGLNMEGPGFGAQGANKYQYNSKELNSDFGLNWNDYGARFYDASIARWNTLDPLTHIYKSTSPYAYVENNPVQFFDVEGLFKFPGTTHNRLRNYLMMHVQNDVQKSPLIMEGLKKYTKGNLTGQTLINALKWGSGPTIIISDAPGGNKYASGKFMKKVKGIEGPVIYLNKTIADQLENASIENMRFALAIIYRTLLHEAVHYGENLYEDAPFGGPETGADFENDVFFGEDKLIDGQWQHRPSYLGPFNTIDDVKNWGRHMQTGSNETTKINDIRQLFPTSMGIEYTPPPPASKDKPKPKPKPEPPRA